MVVKTENKIIESHATRLLLRSRFNKFNYSVNLQGETWVWVQRAYNKRYKPADEARQVRLIRPADDTALIAEV